MIELRYVGIILAFILFIVGLNSCSKEPVPKSELVTWTEEAKESVPQDLKGRFVRYWEARSKLDWDETYNIEAPHERWLYTRQSYEKRHRLAGKPEKVVVKRMIIHDKDAVELELELTLEDARTMEVETFTPKDYWVRVSGVWYHVEKNPFQRFL